MTTYAVALGSNLGDRIALLRSAVRSIEGLGDVQSISRLYETAPIGGPEQGPYLNAVVVLESDLDPQELLVRLHGIEADAGRERKERWGERTLDPRHRRDRAGIGRLRGTHHPPSAGCRTGVRPQTSRRRLANALVGPDLGARRALEQLEAQGSTNWPGDGPWSGRLGLAQLWLASSLP